MFNSFYQILLYFLLRFMKKIFIEENFKKYKKLEIRYFDRGQILNRIFFLILY